MHFNDIHSHIIPCIDDGSRSLSKSLKMLREMQEYGTENLILTPHYSQRRGYMPEKDEIIAAFSDFKDKAAKDGLSICLHCGCEIEYSNDIVRLLAEGKLLTLAGSKYVLVEFAPYVHSRDIIRALHDIIGVGYIPVIAHIERYPYVQDNLKDILFFKSIGALIQVNAGYIISSMPFFKKLLNFLLQERAIDFVAGDTHNDALSAVQMEKCAKTIERHTSKEYTNDVLYGNAQKILLK